MDQRLFTQNRNAWTYEQLAPYHEQHVAWSMDGKAIFASAKTLGELFHRLDELGLTEYVLGFVPDPDYSEMGGALMAEDAGEEMP